MVAPGWISIPVKNLAICDINLAKKNHLCLYKKCDNLWAICTWIHGYNSNTSNLLLAAGSFSTILLKL